MINCLQGHTVTPFHQHSEKYLPMQALPGPPTHFHQCSIDLAIDQCAHSSLGSPCHGLAISVWFQERPTGHHRSQNEKQWGEKKRITDKCQTKTFWIILTTNMWVTATVKMKATITAVQLCVTITAKNLNIHNWNEKEAVTYRGCC